LIIPNADDIVGKTKDTKLVSEKIPEKKQQIVRKKKLNLILYSIIGLVVLVTGYFIYQRIFLSDLKIQNLDKSIAVLAFKNMSDDPIQEYFSDGISEEILNSLVRIEPCMLSKKIGE